MGKESLVECEEALGTDDFDKTVKRSLIKSLTRLVIRPREDGIEYMLQ